MTDEPAAAPREVSSDSPIEVLGDSVMEAPEAKDLARVLALSASRMLPNAAVKGALHIVSTPIGHLGDISLRALAVLHQVSCVACEDTRHTHTLLARYGIHTPTVALHEHNEAKAAPALVRRLQAGDALALVSDAGTPLLSDPGARLVEAAVDAGLQVVPIPGASAPLAALVASGIAPHPSTIVGFLPRKGEERRRLLESLRRSVHTSVLFEAPNRLVATLKDLSQVTGAARVAAVAREITKRFESIRRGTLAELTAYYEDTPPRGEIVIVLAGAPELVATEESLQAAAAELRASGKNVRDIVSELVLAHGASRNVAYRLAHES